MSTISCSQCNQAVEGFDKFCPHCGSPITESSADIQKCVKCLHINPAGVSFCENCGISLEEKTSIPNAKINDEPKTFKSNGNYSGTMVKSKTSKSWKIFKYIIITVVLVSVIAVVIWYKTDPDAKEKLGNILFGAIVMLIFAFLIWRKSRKNLMLSSKNRKDNNDDDWDDNDDNNNDDD